MGLGLGCGQHWAGRTEEQRRGAVHIALGPAQRLVRVRVRVRVRVKGRGRVGVEASP